MYVKVPLVQTLLLHDLVFYYSPPESLLNCIPQLCHYNLIFGIFSQSGKMSRRTQISSTTECPLIERDVYPVDWSPNRPFNTQQRLSFKKSKC